jgi:hypothetical protein
MVYESEERMKHEVDPKFRAAARTAFPSKGWDWWLVADMASDGELVPLETASDDMILSQADWHEHEEGQIEYGHWLRAFVRWRRRRRLTVVWSAPASRA